MSLPEIAGHELLDLIGSGRCGAVYRANASGKARAVKVFSSMAINRKSLSTAIRAMQQMPHHRGVLAVEDFNFDKSPYYMATPLVGVMTKDSQGRRQWQTPTLETVCHGLPTDKAWGFIYHIADALAWLHRYGIPHGNLARAMCCSKMMPSRAFASPTSLRVGSAASIIWNSRITLCISARSRQRIQTASLPVMVHLGMCMPLACCLIVCSQAGCRALKKHGQIRSPSCSKKRPQV